MKTHSLFGVILAGGSGTRFWPRSRQNTPKQLCKITDAKHTMLEQTLLRLDGFIPVEKRLIVTHHTQEKKTRELSSKLCKHLIAEPQSKNTAAALALAALQLQLLGADEEDVMISLHSDHLVKDISVFQKTLQEAVDLAKEGYLSLVGIVPRSPETGFGYIQRGTAIQKHSYKVKSFKEKPKEALAKEYLASKQYYWNSGIFVWKLKTICDEFASHLPQVWEPLFALYKKLKNEKKNFADLPPKEFGEVYAKLAEIAIDHGILEKSSNCAVVAGDFDWNDVGTWTALTEVFPSDASGNLSQGDVLALNTKNSILVSDGPLLATYGVEDLIVVVENGCVLVCSKEKAQGIKDIVAKLKEEGRKDLI